MSDNHKALPELPDARHRGPDGTGSYFNAYTADQMRAYARAALAQQAATPALAQVKAPATPAAQPADEREAFEASFPNARAHWSNDERRYLSIVYGFGWEAWQARAALEGR